MARPDIYYVGLDIYDQPHGTYDTNTGIADEYILTSAEEFPGEIEQRKSLFDAVVSAHNIEHCLFPEETLTAMIRALRIGGRLYMSFPCAESIDFPKRKGTLNFFDDQTHRYLPNLDHIVNILRSEGCKIDFFTKRYRPTLPFIVGMFLEPLSILMNRCMPLTSTWALYGFETVIWATRTSPNASVS